jgi:predicted DNA-binding protein with PD1-like motif
MPRPRRSPLLWLLSGVLAACTSATAEPSSTPGATVRYVDASDVAPRGSAPHAQHRIVASPRGGIEELVLVLGDGDDVPTALLDLANAEKLRDAHFVAIGGVRDPEVAWFDPERHQFKAMAVQAQAEVLTMSGDITVGADGKPAVHAHVALGLDDGHAWGGHLIRATTSPTLEVYVSEYPTPLFKRKTADGLQLIDPTLDRAPHP